MRSTTIQEEEFGKAHVDKKIKMLEEYLPKSLANNSVFYGIISKGIHELSEEDCLEFFPVMQSFIMMILRQWEKYVEMNKKKRNWQLLLVILLQK